MDAYVVTADRIEPETAVTIEGKSGRFLNLLKNKLM